MRASWKPDEFLDSTGSGTGYLTARPTEMSHALARWERELVVECQQLPGGPPDSYFRKAA